MAQAKQESEEVPAGFFGGAQKWEFIQGNAEGTIGVRKPSRPNPLSWPQSPQAELKRRTHSTGRLCLVEPQRPRTGGARSIGDPETL
jgi:hypothetical protein